MVGGIIGGVSAAINGEDVSAGIAGGAVSGAIFGALTDVTVATGGAAAPVAVMVVGALAGAAGDITTQVVSNTNKGHSLQESISNMDGVSIAVSGFCGAAAGGISYCVGKLINQIVFEPAKKAFIDNTVRYVAKETGTYIWKPIISAATRTGLFQLGADALITAGQTAMYFGINRFINRYFMTK